LEISKTEEKLRELQGLLSQMGRAVVAFSGGVDSTFLLKVALDVLGDNLWAVLLVSPLYPQRETEEAKKIARELGVKRLIEMENPAISDEEFLSNGKNRCYICKRRSFFQILQFARAHQVEAVIEGSNLDDLSDYRPGRTALQELAIRSPLIEVGLSKGEIRQLARELGLPNADKPSFSCLASRIPYGFRISLDLIKRIEEGEEFLRELGFKQFRARHHGEIVRIEVDRNRLELFSDPSIRERTIQKFHELGYTYVVLDLEGYRTGSLNQVLSEDEHGEN
jgi:uncharacterized protein